LDISAFHLRLLPIAGSLLAALAGTGVAQDEYEQAPDLQTLEELPETASEQGIPVDLRFRSDTRFVVGSDFDSSNADLYWPRGSLRVGVPLSKRAAARFRINGGAARYDFDGATDLLGRDPGSVPPGALFDPNGFDDLFSGSFALEAAYRVDDTWSLFAQSFIASNWEDGATFDDALSGGGGFAIGFRIPDRFELIVGAGLRSRLDRSGPRPYPLIDLEWKISDRWKLRSHGEGLAVEYALADGLLLFVRGRIESSRYRLDARPGPASRGTLRDRQIPVGVGFRWAVGRHLRIGAVAGVMAYHQLKVRDDHRNTIETSSADPAPFFEVRFDLRP